MKVNLNKLLVLEDNEHAGAMILRLAQRAGYRTTCTTTVAEFMLSYVTERPSLIAMDLILGDADCSAAVEFLAKCQNEVPIVLMTGHNASFLDVIGNETARLGQKVLGRVEKRRTLFRLEEILARQHIQEIDIEAVDAVSMAGNA